MSSLRACFAWSGAQSCWKQRKLSNLERQLLGSLWWNTCLRVKVKLRNTYCVYCVKKYVLMRLLCKEIRAILLCKVLKYVTFCSKVRERWSGDDKLPQNYVSAGSHECVWVGELQTCVWAGANSVLKIKGALINQHWRSDRSESTSWCARAHFNLCTCCLDLILN